MIPVAIGNRILRNARCSCCWRQKPRELVRPLPGAPPITCPECITAGCTPKYAGYWNRGGKCPAKARSRKAGRLGGRPRRVE